MQRQEQLEKRTKKLIVAALAFSVLPVAAQDDDELLEQLRACRAIADDNLRLVCYDMLGKIQSRTPAVAEAVSSPTASSMPEPADPPAPPAAAAAVAATSSPPVQSAPEPVAAAPVAEQTAAREPQYAPLTDDVGAWNVQSSNEATSLIRATVTRCFQNARDDYYFHFENGQIWKYKGNRRLHYKECNFDVTITKDGFGYKMQPIGEDRTLRISRVD